MNRFILFFLCFFAASQLAAQSYEGKGQFEIENHQIGEKSAITWYKKGPNHRLEVKSSANGQSVEYILLLTDGADEGIMLAAPEGRKAQYKFPLSQMQANDTPLQGADFRKSGAVKKVADIDCEVYVSKTDRASGLFYLATVDKLSAADFPPLFKKAHYFSFFEEQKTGLAPLKIETFDANGQPKYSQTLLSLTPETLSETLFVVPDDYPLSD